MIQRKDNHYTVFQSALFATTSTVVQTKDLVLLVDPTWLPQEVEHIRGYVSFIRGDRPLYLLFTHSDWDHILGYGAFPDAVTIGSRALAERSDPESILEQIRTFDDKYYAVRQYPIVFPRIDVTVERDGQQLTVGDTTLTFYLAPGHSDDGIFAIVEPEGVWIAGDYLSDIEFPFIYDGSAAYEETMAKVPAILEKHSVGVMIPGHGMATSSADEILFRCKKSLDYIKETRKAVAEGRESDTFAGLEAYAFPKGMKMAHEDNLRLLRRELGIDEAK
ncbi:MBL fold metallo-hydrolase [Paenibacillus thermotolerans]|uniref:MBL fold metallo-hydrolase n=1 Tax=Paenibacillus thermotolerans TaxID=3027807 RepID=UPI002367C0B5|nr:MULTISPECIES: MBL fold metallo-hydrolase [unclassified Paenibacillus]